MKECGLHAVNIRQVSSNLREISMKITMVKKIFADGSPCKKCGED